MSENIQLHREPLSDCSGCAYNLYTDEVCVKSWVVTYGYDTPEWQAKEKADTEKNGSRP